MSISNKINVMLLDNNEQMRSTIKDFLIKDEKMTIVGEFDSAEDGLKYLQSETVDVIVSDIILPNIDGYTFLERLNELRLAKRPKVIMLSALSSDAFIHKALSLGADYYMVKPCELSVLKERVVEFAGNSFSNAVADAGSAGRVNSQISKLNTRAPRNKQLEEKLQTYLSRWEYLHT